MKAAGPRSRRDGANEPAGRRRATPLSRLAAFLAARSPTGRAAVVLAADASPQAEAVRAGGGGRGRRDPEQCGHDEDVIDLSYPEDEHAAAAADAAFIDDGDLGPVGAGRHPAAGASRPPPGPPRSSTGRRLRARPAAGLAACPRCQPAAPPPQAAPASLAAPRLVSDAAPATPTTTRPTTSLRPRRRSQPRGPALAGDGMTQRPSRRSAARTSSSSCRTC